MAYSDFQSQVASEKIGLCALEASERLVGWTLYSGSIYSIPFTYQVIVSVTDSGTAYTAVSDVASVTASKYYHDRQNGVLYLRASDSSNPNTRFLVGIVRLFFSNNGVSAPHDVASGYDVEWVPLLKPLSDFGVELDNVNQLGVAIEGSGSVKFHNDQDFWDSRFDKLYFENNRCFIYSWNRDLPITEAKLIYRGRVQAKTWSNNDISFQLKDFLNELRAPIITSTLSSLTTSTPALSEAAEQWLQRRVYGYVSGLRPSNIDHAENDEKAYSGTGSTWVVTTGSPTVTLTSGSFLGQVFLIGDQIRFDSTDDDTFYTIENLAASTMTLSANFTGLTTTSPNYTLKFEIPETTYNRKFYVCSHRMREVSTTVSQPVSLRKFNVANVTDLKIGDIIYVGGEESEITAIAGDLVTIRFNLVALPPIGTTVTRPSLTNVYLNDRKLPSTEYTVSYNNEATLITLDSSAEFEVAPALKLSGGNVQFTSGSRSVSGSGTFFKADIKPRDWIRATSESTYFQVGSVESDTALTLRNNCTYTKNEACKIKKPDFYKEGDSVLSCDVIGLSVDGTASAALLKTGPAIAKDILTRAGLSAELVSATFSDADSEAPYQIGLVIPDKYDETKSPTVREAINRINQSIFGALVQNEDFQLEYQIFSPSKPSTMTVLRESDVLGMSVKSMADKIAKTAIIDFAFKEYDFGSQNESNQSQQTTSDIAQYVAKSTKEMRVATLLQSESDATIVSSRYSFINEFATNIVQIKSKLQLARLQVTDKVRLSHEKLFERIGSTSKDRIGSVSLARKSHSEGIIEFDDLGNAFSRCSVITPSTANDWSGAAEEEKLFNGYITDTYGMIDNDPDTFYLNRIW